MRTTRCVITGIGELLRNPHEGKAIAGARLAQRERASGRSARRAPAYRRARRGAHRDARIGTSPAFEPRRLGLGDGTRAHRRARRERSADAHVWNRAQHHGDARGGPRAPHRAGGDPQHDRSADGDRSRIPIRFGQSCFHAHDRLARARGHRPRRLAAELRAASARALPRDARIARAQRPLARRALAAAQGQRGVPVLARIDRGARRVRRAHAFRRRTERHHRPQARRTGAALPRQLRHVDGLAEPHAAQRAPRSRDHSRAAWQPKSRRAVPRSRSFQARQRFDGPCRRRSDVEGGRQPTASRRARRRHRRATRRR